MIPLVLTALFLSLPGRVYHTVDLERMAATSWTHVCTSGPVVYVRKMKDGDVHATLARGKARVVLEIIPLIPLPRPRKGQVIVACGITRYDRRHRFTEIHPVEFWYPVASAGRAY